MDDEHDVELFDPGVTVTKTGDLLSTVGDTVDYTIRIINTSSDDTPTMLLDSITDPLITNLTIPASCQALAPNAFCEFQASRVVLASPDGRYRSVRRPSSAARRVSSRLVPTPSLA